MELGVHILQTETSIRPDRLAVAAEERGFTSVWFSDHTQVPTSRATPFPAGGELPEEQKHLLDPMISLAAAAAVTHNITLGAAVLLVAQRDPIITAKEVSSIDYLSGGRVSVGVGFGWNREEAANHGIDPAKRWKLGRENVLAMQSLWQNDKASFHGELVNVEECWQWPKPVQRPHPPIYVGGAPTPTTFERVAEFGDGWLALGGLGVAEGIEAIRGLAEARGRSSDSIDIVPMLAETDPDSFPAEVEAMRKLKLRQTVLMLPSAPEADILALLDRYTKFVSA